MTAATKGALEDLDLPRVRPVNSTPEPPAPERRKRAVAIAPAGEWATPLPLTPECGPPFPPDALPAAVGQFTHAVGDANQVPLDMVAGAVLGALSVAAARKAIVQAKPNHSEPTNLYVCVVAASGQRKSKIYAEAMAPLLAHERSEAKRRQPELIELRTKRERLEAEKETAKKKAEWERFARLETELQALPMAVEYRLLASDVTAQKLSSMLAEQGGRLGIVSAEPDVFMTMGGRWNKATPELDVFLKGHAGDVICVDRQGRASDHVESPALTMCLGVQPNALRSLARVDGVRERGMLGRFMFAVPRDVRGTRDVRKVATVPPDARADYTACLDRLLALSAPADADELPRLRFTAEAQEAWYTFADEIERRHKRGSGDLRHLHGWGEKFAGMVARIAGLFHLADFGVSGAIELETLRKAIAVGRWAIEHAKTAFGVAELTAAAQGARDILEHLRAERLMTSTRRDVHQTLKGRGQWNEADALTPGFELLTEHGWIRPVPHQKKTGRPSEAFEVHPSIASGGRFEGFENE